MSITAIESTYGNEASTMEKATSLIFFRICRVVAVALQTVSIVAILVDNIQILSTSSVNVLDKYVDLETTSRIWFVSVCTAVCKYLTLKSLRSNKAFTNASSFRSSTQAFLRQFYLTRKMAQRNASGYSPATLMWRHKSWNYQHRIVMNLLFDVNIAIAFESVLEVPIDVWNKRPFTNLWLFLMAIWKRMNSEFRFYQRLPLYPPFILTFVIREFESRSENLGNLPQTTSQQKRRMNIQQRQTITHQLDRSQF